MADYAIFTHPDGRPLRYRLTYPDEPGRPVVILASLLATTAAVWDHVVPALHAAGLRTLAFDHPGHGGTAAPADPAAHTFVAMADDVHALVTAVLPEGGQKAHAWIGCSLGSALGVVYVTRFPGTVDRLVVCDTVSSSPVNAETEDLFTPRVQAIQAAPDPAAALTETLDGTRARWLGAAYLAAHPDTAAWLAALMKETTVPGYAACIAALTSKTFDLGKNAPDVAASVRRVLVVVGEHDAALPSSMARLAERIRSGYVKQGGDDVAQAVQFHVIPGAGHSSFIDGYDAWVAVVLPFLR